MLYKCCNYLIDGLELRYNAIALCNKVSHIGGGDIVVKYYDEKQSNSFKFDLEEFLDKRRAIVEQNQTNNPYPNCKGCDLIHEWEYYCDEKFSASISNIVFHHWTKCNSNCIYCYTNTDKKHFNKLKHYKALPILKSLQQSNNLSYGGIATFAGGEISCLDEFEKISSFLDKYDYFIIYNSSGIIFEKTVEKHLRDRKGMLIVSIDAGKEETHKKIKQVSSFNKIWNNINKYAKACYYKPLLYTKFIVVKNINDNKDEIKLFIDKAKENGVQYTLFDIDLYYLRDNRECIPDYIIDLYHYAYNYAKSINMNMLLYSNASYMLTQGKYKDVFWDDKIFENQNVHQKTIDKARYVYLIENEQIRNKYASTKIAAINTNISYEDIKKSCELFKKGQKYKINNKYFAYELDFRNTRLFK